MNRIYIEGMEWLGLQMTEQNIYRLVLYIDKSKEGRIRYQDFEDIFTNPDEVAIAPGN